MNKFWGHLSTITIHKFNVMKVCFSCGLYKQGILHDLSKYSLTEFVPGVKYFQGNRSPIDKEKEIFGYSEGWLHHKGRNKHHWEYWTDFKSGILYPTPMPKKYIAEMFCDRVAACKTYQKSAYTDASAFIYFDTNRDKLQLTKETEYDIDFLLRHLKDHGYKATTKYIKQVYLK